MASPEDYQVLHLTYLAREAVMPCYPEAIVSDRRLAYARVERQGLGYWEQVTARIIRWVRDGYSDEDIAAEIEAARSAQYQASTAEARSADARAENTAALLAGLDLKL